MEALEKGSQEKESVTQHCCDAVQDKAGRVQELEGSLAILEAQHTSLAEEADSREAQACYFPLSLMFFSHAWKLSEHCIAIQDAKRKKGS